MRAYAIEEKALYFNAFFYKIVYNFIFLVKKVIKKQKNRVNFFFSTI